VKIQQLKQNPNNPRLIKDDKFALLVKSVQEFREMLATRPIVVNKDYVILGGNMRYRACKEAGLKEVPIVMVDWDEEKQKEFVIKDNVGFGEWDWDILANEWDATQLEEWGLDVWQPEEESEEKEEKVKCELCGK
jgi:ParB-like chromosome segregation protein Spo0J